MSQQNYKPRIPGYEILNEIERGALSSLWSAIQTAENRRVLIKVYFSDTSFNPEDIDCNSRKSMFLSALGDMIKCEHPALVRVYDVGFMETGGYIVMEGVEGVQLSQRLEESGALSETEAAKIGVVVAEALQEAWDTTGIMHGNLKPDNILVEADGTIRLMQTGFLQAIGSRMGTPYFMAPEQISGELKMGTRARSDQYGLGLTLYSALTGKVPFKEYDADEAIQRQFSGFLDDPRKICSGISPGMTCILAKMTAKSAKDRYATWDEVIYKLGNPAKVMEQLDQTAILSTIRIDQSLGKKAGWLRSDALSQKVVNRKAGILKPASAAGMIGNRPVPRIKEREFDTTKTPRKKEPQGPRLFEEVAHSRRLRKGMWMVFNMAASLVLMSFLGYYGYMRMVHETDIFVPVRIKMAVLRAGLLERCGFKISPESEIGLVVEASAADELVQVATDQVLSNDDVAKKSGKRYTELKVSQDPQENAKISATKDEEEKESEVVASVIKAVDPQANSALTENGEESGDDYMALLQKAAQEGNAQAQYQLGCIYVNGDKNLPKNAEKAFQWFQKAAEQGVPEAQFNLAHYYAEGDGAVMKNGAKAVFWYRKVAEAGFVEAQCVLGGYYANGKAVRRDWRESLKWYEKAANQGSEVAKIQIVKVWHNLGMSLLAGQGVNVDAKEAVDWLLKAAQSDYAPAQYNLGLCYANGTGTKVNKDQAVYWMRKASDRIPEANQWLKYNAQVIQHQVASRRTGVNKQNGRRGTITD